MSATAVSIALGVLVGSIVLNAILLVSLAGWRYAVRREPGLFMTQLASAFPHLRGHTAIFHAMGEVEWLPGCRHRGEGLRHEDVTPFEHARPYKGFPEPSLWGVQADISDELLQRRRDAGELRDAAAELLSDDDAPSGVRRGPPS